MRGCAALCSTLSLFLQLRTETGVLAGGGGQHWYRLPAECNRQLVRCYEPGTVFASSGLGCPPMQLRGIEEAPEGDTSPFGAARMLLDVRGRRRRSLFAAPCMLRSCSRS